jgi:hypothetical protein
MIQTKIFQIAVFAFILLGPCLFGPVRAQSPTTGKEVHAELKSSGGFDDEDFERLEKGDVVVKKLERTVKREVAMVGAVKLDYLFDLAVKGFRRTLESQKKGTSRQSGKFSIPAVTEDLNDLEFEEGELADLRECRIGRCEWNLSGDIIEALKRDVDWESPEANESAQKILKKLLSNYVREYSESGDGSLMVYRDSNLRVGLEEEYRDLLANLFWIDGREASFASYIRGFPANEPSGARSDYTWSEVKVGLKPVVMFTHSMSLEEGSGETGRLMSVSKQIFANHYFDSSLSVAVLVGVPAGKPNPASYLLFMSRSRASALRGKLSGLLRGLIESQAKGKLESFLKDTKKYTALASANADAALERKASRETASDGLALRGIFYVAVPILAILLGGFFYLLMRNRAG